MTSHKTIRFLGLILGVVIAAVAASSMMVFAQSRGAKPPCGDLSNANCHPAGPLVVKKSAQTVTGDVEIVGKFCINDGKKRRCCPAAVGEYDLCGGTTGGAIVKEKGFMGTPTAWCAANGNCYPVAYVRSVTADSITTTGFLMTINFHWNGVNAPGYNTTGGDNSSATQFTFANPYATAPTTITFTAGVSPTNGSAGYFWEVTPP